MSNNTTKFTPETSVSILEDALRLNHLQDNLRKSGFNYDNSGFSHYVHALFGIDPNILEGNVGYEIFCICHSHLDNCDGTNYESEAEGLYKDLIYYRKLVYSNLNEVTV